MVPGPFHSFRRVSAFRSLLCRGAWRVAWARTGLNAREAVATAVPKAVSKAVERAVQVVLMEVLMSRAALAKLQGQSSRSAAAWQPTCGCATW